MPRLTPNANAPIRQYPARTVYRPQPASDRKASDLVRQGNVPVWMVGNERIFAVSQEQAVAEAERRGAKGKLTLTGYVKLSDQDRAQLQEQAARLEPQTAAGKAPKPARTKSTTSTPTWRELVAQGMDKETAMRRASDMKETKRRARKDEYAPSELVAREQEAQDAAAKLKMDRAAAEIEADREYIESRGGVVGVLSGTEAAKAERTYDTLKRYEVSEGQYDITGALRDRAFTAADLREMGFSQADVSDATERVSMASFPDKTAKVGAQAATQKASTSEPFKGSTAKGAAGPPDATSVKPSPSVAKAGLLGNILMLPYRNSDGTYNLQRMVEGQRVTVKQMKAAGFTEKQIDAALDVARESSGVRGAQMTVGGLTAFTGTAASGGKGASMATVTPNKAEPTSTGVKAAAVRNLLVRYQNKDASYDLQKAIESGRISVRMLTAAGFSDAQIMAAITASMKGLSEKQTRELGALTGTQTEKRPVPESTQEQRVASLAKIMGELNTKLERDIAKAEGKTRDAARESARTIVAMPGEEREWYHWPTGTTVSDEEYRKATNNGNNIKAEEYSRDASQVRRGAIEAVSAFFPVARAALPEIQRSDITTMDALVSAASAATLVIPFVPKGAGAVLQTGAGGVFAANTAKEWGNMSALGKTVGVAASALLLTAGAAGLAQPSFKPVKVPLKDGGEAVVWSGLSLRGKPFIGITKVPPNINTVPKGWRPITKTETSLFKTGQMFKKMGVADDQVDYLLTTFKETKAFQPLRSRYEPKNVDVADVAPQSLAPDELTLVLQEAQKNAKNVEMVYGSTTIKPQLAPELRNWRQLGDIEIQLKPGVTEQQGAELAADMVKALNKNNPGKFSIDPDDAKRILTKGGVHHAVELKLAEVSKLGAEATYSLKRTGEMSWGLKVAQKPITVNYPGVGKLDIMRLSESGVRKADSITRHVGDGTFGPPAHRVKDVADYYVILYTFKNKAVANAWAKVAGYDPKVLLQSAAKDPLKLEAWRFAPDKATPGASPSVSISLPPSMAARVKASSPALYKTITSPVSYAALSTSSSVSSPAASPSLSVGADSASPASPADEDDEESPSPVLPSPDDTSPSPGGSPSTGSSSSPPSTGSPPASPPTTESPPSPPITASPPPPPPTGGGGGGGGGSARVKSSSGRRPQAERENDDTGKVQWKQGAYWIMVEPPATEGEVHKNVQYSRRPFWGVRVVKGTPEQTFATQGKPPREFLYAMGVTRINIHSYEKPHLRYRGTRAGRKKKGRLI